MRISRIAASTVAGIAFAGLAPFAAATAAPEPVPARRVAVADGGPFNVAVKRHVCVKGGACTTLVVPRPGTPMAVESSRLGTWRHIPTDDQCRTTYLGHGPRSIQNGRDLWSVRSQLHPGRFHHYRVVAR